MPWKYLSSEAFQTRHVIAAHHLKDCEEVIEIGSYKTPISMFLPSTVRVIAIDPKLEPFDDGRVKHIQAVFQDVEVKPRTADYGIALMGIELGLSDWKPLYELINGAKTTVIEFSVEHVHSVAQFEAVRKNTRTRIDLTVGLDLAGNDFGDLTGSSTPHCKRRIYILKPV